MGFLLAMLGAAAPRFGLFVFWILRPQRVEAAFDTFLLPLLGIAFVPMATLLYVVLYTSGSGLTGGELFWIVVAGAFDLAHLAVGIGRRDEYRTDSSFRST